MSQGETIDSNMISFAGILILDAFLFWISFRPLTRFITSPEAFPSNNDHVTRLMPLPGLPGLITYWNASKQTSVGVHIYINIL